MTTELLYLAVVFAALVLAAVAAGVSNPVIVGACVGTSGIASFMPRPTRLRSHGFGRFGCVGCRDLECDNPEAMADLSRGLTDAV